MRYEVIREFQYTDAKMQILMLPVGQLVEKYDNDWFTFKHKKTDYQIPSKIVTNNPQFFKQVNWRDDLMVWMKQNKKSTVPAQHKMVVEFFDKHVVNDRDLVSFDDLQTLLGLARDKYNATADKQWIDLFDRLGWAFDNDKIWKKF